MSEINKTPTPLSVMLGSGEDFEVNGKIYKISPIMLIDVEEFMKSNMNLGSQLFSVSDKKEQAKIDRWLGGKGEKKGYCYDEDGNPVTLEKAMADGWSIVDLKMFLRKLCDISG